jgi:hypothetical protein
MFGDPDYPDRVMLFFKAAYEEDPTRAIAMVIHLIEDLKAKNQLEKLT